MFPVLHAKLTFSLKQNKTDQREINGNRKALTKLAYGARTARARKFCSKKREEKSQFLIQDHHAKYQAATQENLMSIYIFKYHKNIFL